MTKPPLSECQTAYAAVKQATRGTSASISSVVGLPPELVDVALVDAKQCASAANISMSLWFELVRTGKAPQPVFRGNRCTRYRLADVRAWLVGFAKAGVSGNTPSKAKG